jgi:hypothetical protein
MVKVSRDELNAHVAFTEPELAAQAQAAGITPADLIGKGEGFTEDEEGYRDFGPCSWCGVGHYIGAPGALWGVCNYCGAE